MSGLDLQRNLVTADSRIPIVFITHMRTARRGARALEVGTVAFLYKPCRQEMLLKAISSALNH
jgi:FixJ family two-component response regulator